MPLQWSISRPHGKFIDSIQIKNGSCFLFVFLLLICNFYPFLCFQLLYLDSTKFEKFHVVRLRPAILNWSTTLMRQRLELELAERKLGRLELNPEWTEAEAKETEGFIDVVLSESSDKEVCFIHVIF